MENNYREKIDLAGEWEIVFDPENQGMKLGWVDCWPDEPSLPVHVPGIWNLTYPDADGVGFYRTAFTVPEAWQDRAILLNFEGVIYRCDVWVNGRYAGSHEGGYTPFSMDVTSLARLGQQNQLIVRVAALSKKKAVDGIQLQHAPVSKQSWYYVYGGIWGKVFLEACPMVAVETVKIDPCLRQEQVQVEVALNNRDDEFHLIDLRMQITDPNGEIVLEQAGVVSALPGVKRFTYTLSLPRALAWTCEQPNLYRLDIQAVEAGDGVDVGETDVWKTNFGMRDFTVHNGAFSLNGEPVYIRGVLLQPNFPVTLIEHPNREMMEREIMLVKQAGFNLIRIHLQPAPPGYLDLADRLGMLIYSETSMGWIRKNPRMLEHGQREIEALIARDRNHPSVVFWGIYNENPPASAINGAALSRYARSIDPTRVVVDNSGGSLAIDQDFGWIDRASMIPAFETQPEKILDVHLYLGAPISRALSGWISDLGRGNSSETLVAEKLGSKAVMEEFDRECRGYNGKIFVSELGYGGMSDLDETVAGFDGREDLLDSRELKTLRDSLREGFQKRDLEKVFGSRKNLYQQAQEIHALGNTQQLQALLMNPRVSGYIITQLNDMAWEFHAGLLDLWRNPKRAYYAAQRINQPHVIVLRPSKRAFKPGSLAEIEMGIVNRAAGAEDARLRLMVTDPSGQEVYNTQTTLRLHPGIHAQDRARVPVGAPGTYEITARLLSGTTILAEASDVIQCVEPVDWNCLPFRVALMGPARDNALSSFLDGDVPASAGQGGDARPVVSLAAQPALLTDGQWEALMQTTAAGGTTVIAALQPEDSTAIQALARHGIDIRLHFGIGSWMGCYHWAAASEVFSDLPAGGVMMAPYSEILPKYILSELGGKTLAGSLRNTQSMREPPAILWFSDIEVLPFEEGRLVFCQYRAFEALDHDPLAARLAYNLLAYAARLAGVE